MGSDRGDNGPLRSLCPEEQPFNYSRSIVLHLNFKMEGLKNAPAQFSSSHPIVFREHRKPNRSPMRTVEVFAPDHMRFTQEVDASVDGKRWTPLFEGKSIKTNVKAK
jgi:hypothetical protein